MRVEEDENFYHIVDEEFEVEVPKRIDGFNQWIGIYRWEDSIVVDRSIEDIDRLINMLVEAKEILNGKG